MATANFKPPVLTAVYAVLLSYEDPDTGDTVTPDEHEVGEHISYMLDALEGHDKLTTWNRTGHTIKVSITCTTAQVDIEACAQVGIFPGYYQGASWDVARMWVTYNGADDPECGLAYTDLSAGMQAIQLPNVTRAGDRLQAELTAILDEFFTGMTTPLTRIATFSNGEAIYKKVEA